MKPYPSGIEVRKLAATEAEQIAKEAYVYLYPLVQNYLTIYQLALNSHCSQYKCH
jgi:hypothetical protein